jgi:hypothetical protein
MKDSLKRLSCWVLIVLAAPFLSECVDTSPLAYVPPERDSGAPIDGATDAPLIRSCRKCISGDGEPCRALYDTCSGLPKCVDVLDCVLDHGCFGFPDLATRFECGSPCLAANGVLAANNPVIQTLAQINVCVVNSCSDACFMK